MTTNDQLDAQVALDVAAERSRQNAKWGEQNHPDGTGPDTNPLGDFEHRKAFQTGRALSLGITPASTLAACATEVTDVAAKQGNVTWADILTEEHFEALAEADPVKLRSELVQIAAVAQQWAAAIDRRGPDLHIVILSPDAFTVVWDAERTFPFFEDENGNRLWGYGHQDKSAFAELVNDYDRICDPKGWDAENAYTTGDVTHSWGIAYTRGQFEDDWIISRHVASTLRELTHGSNLPLVGEDTVGAFALTYISR